MQPTIKKMHTIYNKNNPKKKRLCTCTYSHPTTPLYTKNWPKQLAKPMPMMP
eukprot:m.202802 g.202802  ORF g.202802 m.202802 type:complete len:52 (+) comp21963_c0_seq5:43-198(+)